MGQSMSIGDFIKNQLVLGSRAGSETGTGGATGAPGMDGMDGKTIRYGTIAPTAAVGNDGDFFINTTTSFLYGPKTNNAWPSGISLIGPKGAKGDTGSKGDAGTDGTMGPQGPIGNTGAQGSKGEKGDTGSKGEKGDTGAQGAKGNPGVGLPTGGHFGQALVKVSDVDYEAAWFTITGDQDQKQSQAGAIDSISSGTNRFLTSAAKTANFSNLTTSAYRLYYVPFFLRQATTIAGLAVNVSTAGGAGALARAGIYERTDAGYIGSIMAYTTDIDVSTTGIKQASLNTPMTLEPGWYFTAFVTNIAVGITSYSTVITSMIGTNPLGMYNITPIEYRYEYNGGSISLPMTASLSTTAVNNNTAASPALVFMVAQ